MFLCSALLTVSLASAAIAAPARPEDGAAPAPGRAARRDDGAWTVSLGTGAGGLVEFADPLVGGPTGAGAGTRRSGRLQANVRAAREHGRWLRTGLAYTHQRWKNACFSAGAPQGTIHDTVHVLLADVTLSWVRGRDVELYSGVAAGGSVWRERGTLGGTRRADEEAGFAFQVRALGLSLGGEHVRAFAEVGLGFEGILIGGVAARF